jgi:hypothetical protein
VYDGGELGQPLEAALPQEREEEAAINLTLSECLLPVERSGHRRHELPCVRPCRHDTRHLFFLFFLFLVKLRMIRALDAEAIRKVPTVFFFFFFAGLFFR